MRTQVLIAALLLSASAAHAGTRSLSGPQANPVEAPAYQVQSVAQPQAAETPKLPEQPTQVRAQPVQAAPLATTPVEAPASSARTEATPVQADPATDATPAEATVASEPRPERPVRHKRERRHLTVEQRVDREFRKIERTIQRHIGSAFAGGFSW